jgi:hypothetical protein
MIFFPENNYQVKTTGVFSEFQKPKYAVKNKPFILECIGYGRYDELCFSGVFHSFRLFICMELQ